MTLGFTVLHGWLVGWLYFNGAIEVGREVYLIKRTALFQHGVLRAHVANTLQAFKSVGCY
jgi:hypothetical protein